MSVELSQISPIPEGALAKLTAPSFQNYRLVLDGERTRAMLAKANDLLVGDDGAEFLRALDPDLRNGALSIHVANKSNPSPIKFSGASLELSLTGNLREIAKEERGDIMRQVAQYLVDNYAFEKVSFRNPDNERLKIEIARPSVGSL